MQYNQKTVYDVQRMVSDRYNNQIIDILYDTFGADDVRYGTEYEDCKLATDFVVTRNNRSLNVGARIREFEFYDKYKHEFTVRANTEINKIRSGMMDYMLYGFGCPFSKDIISYKIIDINIFRNSSASNTVLTTVKNTMGTYNFFAFNFSEFQPDLIITSYDITNKQKKMYDKYYKQKQKDLHLKVWRHYENRSNSNTQIIT